MSSKIALTFTVLFLALVMNKALANQVDYTLTNSTSGDEITFDVQLPLTIEPSSCIHCFAVTPEDLIVNGVPFLDSNEQVNFYDGTSDGQGGLLIWDPTTSAFLINQGGPETSPGVWETLYSGTLDNPTLENFTNFQLTGYPAQFSESFVLNATITPEPGSFLLLGSGLLVMAGFVRRKIAR